MKKRWFWCPKCNRVAPQLGRLRFAKLHKTFSFSAKKIVFALANPIMMGKLILRSFTDGHKSLSCGPCQQEKMELLAETDSRVISSSNYKDLKDLY